MDRPDGDEPSIGDDLSELLAIGRRLDKRISVDERVSLRDRQRELRSRWVPDFRSSSIHGRAAIEEQLRKARSEIHRRSSLRQTGEA